jgi:hypothetical protein
MRSKWRNAFGIGLAVTAAAALVWCLAPASAAGPPQPPPPRAPWPPMNILPKPPGVHHVALVVRDMRRSRARPIAGKTFAGLAIETQVATISGVRCGAEIAGLRLTAQQTSFFEAGHQRDKVICRWRIPAYAASERLRADGLVINLGSGWLILRPRLNWKVRRGPGSTTANNRHPAVTIAIGLKD